MPTFTTIALDNLLDLDRDSSSYSKPRESVDNSQVSVPKRSDFGTNDDDENVRVSPKHIYVTPGLYTTPEPAPIPEVSSEFSTSPSPYIVKHKRRGGGGDEGRRIGGVEIPGVAKPVVEAEAEERECLDLGEGKEEIEDEFLGVGGEIEECLGEENEVFEFLDPVGGLKCEMESVGSVNEGGNCLEGVENYSFVSAQGEFFDANEEFSSDGSFSSGQSRRHSVGSEIQAIRLSLLEEIERRKKAEDTLRLMQNQWQQIVNLLAQVGLALPALPISGDESLEQLIQEVVVTKFVAEAMGKAVARAEAELVSQTILESKEQEISRLRDRLQYYEAVNLEMSQRNQEIVEVARKQRQKRQRQRKWLWSCVGLSISIGATVIASSYLPATGKEPQFPSSGDPVDGNTSSDTV